LPIGGQDSNSAESSSSCWKKPSPSFNHHGVSHFGNQQVILNARQEPVKVLISSKPAIV